MGIIIPRAIFSVRVRRCSAAAMAMQAQVNQLWQSRMTTTQQVHAFTSPPPAAQLMIFPAKGKLCNHFVISPAD
jgi:hypothetical protein